MKLAAAYAISDHIQNPTLKAIIPSSLDMAITTTVADAVKNVCKSEHHVAH